MFRMWDNGHATGNKVSFFHTKACHSSTIGRVAELAFRSAGWHNEKKEGSSERNRAKAVRMLVE